MGCQVLTHRGVRLKSAPEETQPFPSGFGRRRDAPNDRFRGESKDQIPRFRRGESVPQLALLAFDQAASQNLQTSALPLPQHVCGGGCGAPSSPPCAAERDVRKTNTAVTNRRGRTTWRGEGKSPVITSAAAAAAQALISSFGASARRLCVPPKERRGNKSAAFANPDSASLCNNQDEF